MFSAGFSASAFAAASASAFSSQLSLGALCSTLSLDLALGQTELCNQRDTSRADVSAGAALDAVHHAAVNGVVQILLLAVYIHVDRQEMHRAGVDALAAADTLGILNALILIACKGEECVGALDNRGIQRELGVAHHRAAGKELVRSFL